MDTTHHLETIEYTLYDTGGKCFTAELRHVFGHGYKLGEGRLIQCDHI